MDEIDVFKKKFKNIVGFDAFLEYLSKSNNMINYPPYNIKKVGNVTYISIALAGFKKEDLSVDLVDNQLEIIGKKPESIEDSDLFIHKGIASRNFKKTFLLEEGMYVSNASLEDGLLHIAVKQPEKQINRINIPIRNNDDNIKHKDLQLGHDENES